MIEVVGIVLLVVGTFVSVLAAWGIVDFPTPLSRMHAATKPASLGLAATVLGAALAATEPDLVALAVLVAGGLFLTAPITGHLLGRAAYLADQAPDLVHDDLAGVSQPPAAADRPRGRWGVSLLRISALTVTWMILWGDLAVGTALAGVVVAIAVEVVVGGRGQPYGSSISFTGMLRFGARYLWLVVASTGRVAWEVITPRNELIREAIVAVPLRVASEPAVVLLANAVTYTPGTLTIEVADGHLFVHVLHFEGVDAAVADVRRIEDLVMAALPGPVRS